MYRHKLLTAVLTGALATGTILTGGAFAIAKEQPRRHQEMGMNGMRGEVWRDVVFVRMLKQFDTDHDGKISKEEGTAGVEKIFDAIDTNHDGSITPGEFRAYRKAEMKSMRAEMKGMAESADDAAGDGQNGGKDKGPGPEGHGKWQGHGPMRHGGMMASRLFRMLDTDENGQISKQEAMAAFDKLFARMDTNKDGFISIDDLPNRPFL
ncbi:EF-hand domain-containing protein [Oryzifoliimicrobium ureilyticus]|uniref:EF-hand domain-containing protein n=1 Tax=Oryzifoliimicrobium ureilyticus TaxID=3113724 RepID=UPI00307645F4